MSAFLYVLVASTRQNRRAETNGATLKTFVQAVKTKKPLTTETQRHRENHKKDFLISNELQPASPEQRRSGLPARHGRFLGRRHVFNASLSGKYARPTLAFLIRGGGNLHEPFITLVS
jgi:hypothetical protein